MSETTNQKHPMHDGDTSSMVDPELDQLLNEAYAAPPVPRSLLERIDCAVESEWGVSPQLAGPQRARFAGSWGTWARRTLRGRRSISVAGTVAALVMVAFILSAGPRTYAWSTMLDALARGGLVELAGPAESRFLSLSEGVMCVRSEESVRIFDLSEQVVLERDHDRDEAVRHDLGRESGMSRDSLVAGFLLGANETTNGLAAWRGVQPTAERWESETVAGRKQVALTVTLASAEREPVTLRLTLDPETSLPLTCTTVGESRSVASLSYPSVTLAEIRERELPSTLRIIPASSDGASETGAADATLADGTSTSESPSRDGIVAMTNVPSLNTTPVIHVPNLTEAPSKWPAVKPIVAQSSSVVQQVDRVLNELWAERGVDPTAPADEEELLRRVYLDLVGRTPSVVEVRDWLSDRTPNRYEALVDRLLRSPDHASHLAAVWRSFLIPEGVDLDAFGGVQEFDRWLASRFASDDSYDEIVRSLLLAEGRLSRSGPLLFYSAVKLDPEQLAARTSRVFLGMRLECAQCHDHPFEPWAQEEFWGFAAFFAQISRPRGDLESVSSVMRVRDIDRGDVMIPETEHVVAPSFLDGTELPKRDGTQARREQLAAWLTSPDNPYFARATANRVWGQMFGKGIVDPIDDFGTLNPPVSPALLDLLAGHFVGSDFSLRELFRVVALSSAYRLSSGAATEDNERLKLFAQMNVKTLTAEQVYDCITVATLLDSQAPMPDGFTLSRIANPQREAFVRQFRTPAGRSTEYLGGIPQALTLMNGRLISGATGLSTSGLLASLEAPFFTNEQRIEVLFLATLSRRPRPGELEMIQGYLGEDVTGDAMREGLADTLWALLNSAEFVLNH